LQTIGIKSSFFHAGIFLLVDLIEITNY
jgi:hypothetical protein